MYLEENLNLPIAELLEVIQSRITTTTTYHGIKTLKNPMDFWVYQELIFQKRPDVIIEIGNNYGGSTLALAHQLDLIGNGRIIGIDIDHSKVPDIVKNHARIELIESPALDAFPYIQHKISATDNILLIEDSSHTFKNTLGVLMTYQELISPGGYMIVEDTICHHGLNVGPKPGPYEAVEKFMESNEHFIIDREMESFMVTWNPKGFLRRIR